MSLLVVWLERYFILLITTPRICIVTRLTQIHEDAEIFENHLKPFILVMVDIGKLPLSTLRWLSMCQGFIHFSGFLHHFVLAKLATSIKG